MAFSGVFSMATSKDTSTMVKSSASLWTNPSTPQFALTFRGVSTTNRSVVARSSSLTIQPVVRIKNSYGSNEVMHTLHFKGTPFSGFPAASSAFFGEDSGGLVPMQSHEGRGALIQLRAHRYSPFGFRYPEITKKPIWWLRTLACIPYLLALQLSDAGYFLHPFANRYAFFENVIFYVPGACNRLPGWFSRWYHIVTYLLVVKNRKVPHFFRFHLMMGMLMEVALQLVWMVSNFMPLMHHQGTFGVEYWGVVAFAYIALLLECVRCALVGKYADIMFLDESAYIHTLFGTDLKIGGIF